MFNPHQFLRPNVQTAPRIALEKLSEYFSSKFSHSRSRWDEPIAVPDVLYTKFRLPPSRQEQTYPLSLVDFIKKAYDRCNDEAQARIVEQQLRQLISKHQNDLFGCDWQSLPLPSPLPQQRQPIKAPSIREITAKLHPISVVRQAQPSRDTDQSSKAKQKVSKTLERLEEKLSRREEGRLETEPKMFIGFHNQPEHYQPPPIQSQINPALRVILNPPPPPPPLQPKPSQIERREKERERQRERQRQRQREKEKERQKERQRERDRQRERERERQKEKQRERERQKQKQRLKQKQRQNGSGLILTPSYVPPASTKKGKVVVTRKQLTQIVRAAENRGQLQQVAKRWESFNKLKPDIGSRNVLEEAEECDNEMQVIVGKSSCIDKPYLRITGRPDPDSVRPQPILRQALIFFVGQYRRGGLPYDSLLSQFKSIRQDLTVQHIRSSLTVQVYEQNMRMSLFEHDLIQVRHCQANIWELYREGLYSTEEKRNCFISYHCMTLILEGKYKELEYILTLLPPGCIQNPIIQESLTLKRICLLGNYRAFFDYLNSRDQVSRQLINLYADRIRVKCLVAFCKTSGEKIQLTQLANTVGEDEDVLEALIRSEGGFIRQGYFMLKESYEPMSKSEFLKPQKVTNLLC